jgi:hypothetical protein
MAKVTAPLHSSEARGRMGGLVYNTFRGMATVKAKHAPAQPRSPLQLAVRARAVDLARAWADNAYQANWNAYAAAHPYLDGMGLTIRATGLNWYIALNSRLLALGVAAVETPPADPAPGAVDGFVPTGGAGEIVCVWTDPTDADHKIEFWMDGPHTAGRQGSLPKAHLAEQRPAAAATYTFTGLLPGTYTLWVRALTSADGQVGPWATASTVVT